MKSSLAFLSLFLIGLFIFTRTDAEFINFVPPDKSLDNPKLDSLLNDLAESGNYATYLNKYQAELLKKYNLDGETAVRLAIENNAAMGGRFNVIVNNWVRVEYELKDTNFIFPAEFGKELGRYSTIADAMVYLEKLVDFAGRPEIWYVKKSQGAIPLSAESEISNLAKLQPQISVPTAYQNVQPPASAPAPNPISVPNNAVQQPQPVNKFLPQGNNLDSVKHDALVKQDKNVSEGTGVKSLPPVQKKDIKPLPVEKKAPSLEEVKTSISKILDSKKEDFGVEVDTASLNIKPLKAAPSFYSGPIVEIEGKVSPYYEVSAHKNGWLFYFIPVKMNVAVVVDIEKGNINSIRKPWWGFFVRER